MFDAAQTGRKFFNRLEISEEGSAVAVEKNLQALAGHQGLTKLATGK
jgi:hypothetical protein